MSQEIDPIKLLRNWFSRRKHTLQTHFDDFDVRRTNLAHHLSLSLIILVSLIVRLFPLLLGWDPHVKALDPHMQVRAAEFINEHGYWDFLQWWDQYSWYPAGREMGDSLYVGVPLAILALYNFIGSFGFDITISLAAYFVPVVFGTIATYFSYLLGKELISSRAGLFAAMIMAVTPSFVSRSIAGFVDNESVGVLFTISTLYLFARAYFRDSNRDAILAGLSMFLLSASWGAFRFTYDFLPLLGLILIVTGRFSMRFFKAYTTTILISTMLMITIPRIGPEFLGDIEGIAPLGFIAFMIFYSLLRTLSHHLPPLAFRKTLLISFLVLSILLGGIIAILTITGAIDIIGDKFISVLVPTDRNNLPLIASVSEHLPLAWGNLFANLTTMVFLIPLGIYFALKYPTEKNIFLLTFGLTCIYFSGSMVRLLLLLAPAASLLSALAIDNLLMPYANAAHGKIKLTKITMTKPSISAQHAATSYFIVFLMLMILIGQGVTFATYYSTPDIAPGGSPQTSTTDWLDTFAWMREHTSYAPYMSNITGQIEGKPSIMLSWWDYGYYITAQGQTISLVDNATFNSTQIGVVATMLMWNASASIKLMYNYNVDYVLVVPWAGLSNSDLRKALWMIQISQQYTEQYGIVESDYYRQSTPDISGGLDKKFYDSVLWKLMAYHAPDMPDNDQRGRAPFCTDRNSGCIQSVTRAAPEALQYQVNHDDPSMSYFKEVFRSSGAFGDYNYPLIRIYEVKYPTDIAQQVAELNEIMNT